MDHSFCVGSHLYGLFKILFDLIQCWLWVGCGLVFQMGFPYIPDNAVQIIMKDMAVKIVLLYLTQFQRPHIQIIFSRCVFFKNGLPGSFQNQIHLVHPHISDLVNKDFHINHQPQKIWMSRQFTKQAVVDLSAAQKFHHTLFGLTACAGTTDSKDNNDDNALIQGTWEIDTGSGAGYKFVDDKFMWLKSIENVNDNYWYGDVEYYNGAEAMEIAGLTEEELKSSLPGLKPENIFVTKLDPEKIITDGEDKTATNMNDQTLWTRLWLIEENEDNVVAVVFDLETFSMESYTKVK